MDHSTKLDISVGTSSACFPKFVHRCSTLFRELRKAKGTSKPMISSAAFDLKFLLRTRSKVCRNFKSAALAPHGFAVRLKRGSSCRVKSGFYGIAKRNIFAKTPRQLDPNSRNAPVGQIT